MASASATASAPRYAPEDSSLPKPWRGLIDGATGYLYFWNPETNITQYERPVAEPSSYSPSVVPPQSSSSVGINSTVHVQQSSGYRSQHDSKEDNGRYGTSGSQHQQVSKTGGNQMHNFTNGPTNGGNESSYGYSNMHSSQNPKPYVKAHGSGSSDYGGNQSVEAYRRQHEITVSEDGAPAPFMTFDSTLFPAEILREVHQAGFSAPTPIQAQSWPIALQSRDLVAVAKTGSGKTLGYLLPSFLHLNRVRNNSRMGPTVLVLSPTRELATQILAEAVRFGKSSRLACTCLYGGAPKGPQLRDLDRGVDVVVATPGRLNDILEIKKISLRQVSYLVLDEADRMLDMGFEPQIRKIVKEIPPQRQTLMFTATWPREVRKIASDLLAHPVQVNIGNIDELVANKSIAQRIEMVMPMEKQRRVEQILRSQEPGSKILIFCSTKKMCNQLSRTLYRQFGAAVIHGDKSQMERDHALNQFRSGRCPILVATDVAARGLDVKDIRVVINYDFPTGIEDYVHRIGRTGRAGASGVAYTFFSDQDSKHASDLVKVLEGASQPVPPEIRAMGSRGSYGKIRKWGPSPGGYGGGRGDSAFGGRGGDYSGFGGRGRGGYGASSARSEISFGGRGSDHSNRSYHDSYVSDTRGRQETKSTWGNNDRRSRSRSYSPNRRGGFPNNNQNNRSRSRSPYRISRNQGIRSPPHSSITKTGSVPLSFQGNNVEEEEGLIVGEVDGVGLGRV